MKEFLLSDESLNGHGFVVLTSGIKMERFLKNPIMLFQHDRERGVAGRWENLRISDNALYGSPVFDGAHEPGKTVKEQVEGGFLNGASIGIYDIQMENINGINTVVSCELDEVSICDIPSNRNAVQLYFNRNPVDFPTYLKLSKNEQPMNEQEFKALLQALGLPPKATAKDMIEAIEILKNLSSAERDTKESLRLALEDGAIKKEEFMELNELFGDSPIKLHKYLTARRKTHQEAIAKEYELFIDANRMKLIGNPLEEVRGGYVKRLAMKDFESFKKMVDNTPKPLRPMDLVNPQGIERERKRRHEWTLEDYRKNAPNELRNNTVLYNELIEKEINENKNKR